MEYLRCWAFYLIAGPLILLMWLCDDGLFVDTRYDVHRKSYDQMNKGKEQ